MTLDPDSPSRSDIELDPFAIMEFVPSRDSVVTHSGEMTLDAAAERFVDELRAYDWQQFLTDRECLRRDYPAELFIGMSRIGALASLMAEIDLYRARLLWSRNVPFAVGTLRMFSLASEAQELAYQEHLSNLRRLSDDVRIGYLLEHSDAMREWGGARVHLTECSLP